MEITRRGRSNLNREKHLIRNTIIIGIGTFLPRLASIITLPIVTAYLSKTEYGTYDLILTLISLILPLTTIQIQSSAFRFLVECRNDENRKQIIISNIWFFTILASIIPIITIYLCIGNYNCLTRMSICLYFFFDIIMHTVQQIVRGLGDNKSYSFSTVCNALINMLLVILFVKYMQFGLLGIVLSLVMSNSISTIFLVVKCSLFKYIRFSTLSRNEIKSMLAYSWPLIPNNLSSWIMTLSDRLLLALFMGVEVNAVYAVSKKIPNLLTTVQSTFSQAWQENASLSSKDDDIDEYYTIMFANIFDIVIGACSLLIGMSPVLFSLLIKGDYAEAFSQMPLLFLGMTFMTLSSYLAGIYIADKRTKEIGVSTSIAAFINLLIDVIAIPFFGMYAASISTLISYFFLFIYRILDLKKYHNIKFNFKMIVMYILYLTMLCVVISFNHKVYNLILLVIGMVVAVVLNKKTIIFVIGKIFRRGRNRE